MGIWGFSSFLLNEEKSSLKPFKLQNNHLVIDGNNMIRWTMCNCFDSVKYGGNYDVHYEHVKTIFLNFIKCNVKPIVLFDGQSENGKQDVKFKRWKDNVRLLRRQNITSNKCRKLVPYMIQELFVDVLSDLNITYFKCLKETDKEAAIIANALNCPVLSFDSDFCFFNIQYLQLNLLDFQVKGSEPDYYLDCVIFNREYFMTQYKLTPDMIMLFPVLFGEEQNQKDIFTDFLELLMNFRGGKQNHNNFSIAIKWMQKMGSFDCAVKNILSYTKECDHSKVLDVIQSVIDCYTLTDNPISPYIKINKTESKIEITNDPEGYVLPEECKLSHYPKYVINAYIKNKIFSKIATFPTDNTLIFTCVGWEDFRECSPSQISLPIFSGVLQISKRVLGVNNTERIILRKGMNHQEVLMYNSENFLIGVSREIFAADVEERRRVFFEVLDFGEKEKSVVKDIGKDWSIFVISIVYWLKNRRSHMRHHTVERSKVGAILMTALIIQAKSVLVNDEENCEFGSEEGVPSISRLLATLSDRELFTFAERFEKFRTEMPEIDYSISTVHGFNLLQCCICNIGSLNTILIGLFPDIKIHKFFSGILAHNLSELMTDPLFVEKELKDTPNVRNLYYSLMVKIYEAVGHH